MKTFKHCGVTYKEIVAFTEESLFEIISVNDIEYRVERLKRPCKNYSDLAKVFCNGKEYSTYAKFLKSVK
jgi:hypothetical protein